MNANGLMRQRLRAADGLPRWLLASVVGLGLLAVSSAVACQVPVFRYALERWLSDDYELLVLYSQPLSEEDQGTIARLTETKSRQPVNLNVRAISLAESSLAESSDRFLKQLWTEHGSPKEPLSVLLYPRTASEVPDRVVDVGPLRDEVTGDLVTSDLVTSPVREALTERLTNGDSAVWVFVSCGEPAQDAVALKTLQDQLPENETRLTLPSVEEMELEPEQLEKVKINLRIGFSMVTLDRDDPRERVTLRLLLRSEADLESLDEPMVFPVFGRGRVLYALIGAGISPENIRIASSFMVGPCSCQVKKQNPGFDLLLWHDWESSVGEVRLSDPLPDESSVPVLLQIPSGRPSR